MKDYSETQNKLIIHKQIKPVDYERMVYCEYVNLIDDLIASIKEQIERNEAEKKGQNPAGKKKPGDFTNKLPKYNLPKLKK